MKRLTCLVMLFVAGAISTVSAQLQLNRFSFDFDLWFQPDNANSNAPNGPGAHAEIYFASDPDAAEPFWRMSLKDDQGAFIYDVWRPLSAAIWDGESLTAIYYRQQWPEPGKNYLIERLEFRLLFDSDMEPTGFDIDAFMPYQLYAGGDTEFMGHAPIGYGGYFYFASLSNFSATRVPAFSPFTPVPEPSTYGWGAAALMIALAWRRRRRGDRSDQPSCFTRLASFSPAATHAGTETPSRA